MKPDLDGELARDDERLEITTDPSSPPVCVTSSFTFSLDFGRMGLGVQSLVWRYFIGPKPRLLAARDGLGRTHSQAEPKRAHRLQQGCFSSHLTRFVTQRWHPGKAMAERVWFQIIRRNGLTNHSATGLAPLERAAEPGRRWLAPFATRQVNELTRMSLGNGRDWIRSDG